MLANKHLNEEIKVIEGDILNLRKAGKIFEADSLKIGVLSLKLLQNLRANDVRIMEASGIELLKTDKEGDTSGQNQK